MKLYTINTTNNFMEAIFRPFVEPFCRDHGIEVYNILDDSLLVATREAGGMTPTIDERMLSYAKHAELAGADGVLVTCTSVNQSTPDMTPFLNIPVVNIEEPVTEMAVANGRKIGILATVPTSPGAVERVLRQKAAAAGKEIEVVSKVADGALDALLAGDREKHDAMASAALYELAKDVDVVVFAQISMSLFPFDQDRVGKPVYKIGESGLQRIYEKMLERQK